MARLSSKSIHATTKFNDNNDDQDARNFNAAFQASSIELELGRGDGKIDLKVDRSKVDVNSGFLGQLQSILTTWCKEKKSEIRIATQGSLLVAWLAFVVAAVMVNTERAMPLLLFTALLLFSIVYYAVLKPKFGASLSHHLEKNLKMVKHVWAQSLVRWAFYGVLICFGLLVILVDIWGDRLRLMSMFGLFVLTVFLFVFSNNPAEVNWRPVFCGFVLQFVFGYFVLRVSIGRAIFFAIAEYANTFLSFTDAGTGFVYGFLVTPPKICGMHPIFAFKALSTIIFLSSVMSVLYYFGIMQWLVKQLSAIVQVIMGSTAAESISATANIFIGQSEAPLLIKPYLEKMTASEITAMMTGGFATISGSVFQIYLSFGACGNHLLSASVMSAPAALGVSKLFYPETEESKTKTQQDLQFEIGDEKTFLEAAANGAGNGVILVANIVGNLIAFLAFLKFIDVMLFWLGNMVDVQDLSFSLICSYIFWPLAYIMGASDDSKELFIVAELIGIKTFVNEFIAYQRMSEYIAAGRLSPRAQLISIYSLCGFANLASVGVQLGALNTMCPEKKSVFGKVALRSLIGGSIACFMTACVAGILLKEISYDDCVLSSVSNATCTPI